VREVEIVEGRARIARVLDHEIGNLARPETRGLGSLGGGSAVALQRSEDGSPRKPLVAVAAPEPGLVFPDHRVPLDHEISGAGAVDQSRDRLRIGVKLPQRPLLHRIEKNGSEPLGQHGPDLAQREGTGEVEVEAHSRETGDGVSGIRCQGQGTNRTLRRLELSDPELKTRSLFPVHRSPFSCLPSPFSLEAPSPLPHLPDPPCWRFAVAGHHPGP
jgi:hypothetical protein